MTRLLLLLLVVARASAAACLADGHTETWTGTIGSRLVTCCARHRLAATPNQFYFDDVTLWCSPAVRRALFVRAYVSPTTGQPEGSAAFGLPADLACRVGPRFHRPLAFKRSYPVLRGHCCPVLATVVGSAAGAFVTGLDGTFDCPARGRHQPQTRIPFLLTQQP
jgi:hypothetical protein